MLETSCEFPLHGCFQSNMSLLECIKSLTAKQFKNEIKSAKPIVAILIVFIFIYQDMQILLYLRYYLGKAC